MLLPSNENIPGEEFIPINTSVHQWQVIMVIFYLLKVSLGRNSKKYTQDLIIENEEQGIP